MTDGLDAAEGAAARLLADPGTPALLRAPVDAARLVEAGESAGRRVVVIGEADSRAAFLDECAEAFALPNWFGRNFDALEECLGELDLPDGGLLVVWRGAESLRHGDPRAYATARDVLAAGMAAWRVDGVPAVTVVPVAVPG